MTTDCGIFGGVLAVAALCLAACGGATEVSGSAGESTLATSGASGSAEQSLGGNAGAGGATGGSSGATPSTAGGAGSAGLTGGGGAGGAEVSPPGAPLPTDHTQVASCRQSASTNAPGITVTIYGDASAERTVDPPKNIPVSSPMSYPAGSPDVLKFLADVRAVGDVSHIPTDFCGKSASFGTTTTVTAYGETSGDLQCASMPSATQTALIDDCFVLLGSSG